MDNAIVCVNWFNIYLLTCTCMCADTEMYIYNQETLALLSVSVFKALFERPKSFNILISNTANLSDSLQVPRRHISTQTNLEMNPHTKPHMLTDVYKSPRLKDGTEHTSWTVHSVWTKQTLIPGTRCPLWGTPCKSAREMQMAQRRPRQSTWALYPFSFS